ncbi:MAG: hypothetical protein K9N55_11145 [Phycisphaerae bacterium]|nr:hypothetical protein [Phycisphaerae bacterium]
MGSLSHEQKQLLFDHCMGLASEQQDVEAELLIASDPDAASFYYEQLKTMLSPLESLECQPCPDSLAERTIRMLTERSHAQPHSKPKVYEQKENPGIAAQSVIAQDLNSAPIQLSTWRSPVQVAAVAAILLFLLSVTVPLLGMVREKMWQTQCQARLGHVGQGMAHYVSDYGDRTPYVAMVSGDPWWKVGYQGSENHSNTRGLFLLAKGRYVEPVNFLCPARKTTRKLDPEALRRQGLHDFPGREYIDYSFRVGCDKMPKEFTSQAALMADKNPLAESLPSDYSESVHIPLNEKILRQNSLNHGGHGQNVLFNDGSIEYYKHRLVGRGVQDDIFMLQNMTPGGFIKGCEVPACATDAFLAP